MSSLPVASVGVKSWYQLLMMDMRASNPTSVAHVTSHRTISRRRQLSDERVMRITCRPSSNEALSRVACRGPSSGVATRKMSCASENRCDELWMCLCADSSTVLSLRPSPNHNRHQIVTKLSFNVGIIC